MYLFVYFCVEFRKFSISISLKFPINPINDFDNPFIIYLVLHSISFRYIVDVEKPRTQNIIFLHSPFCLINLFSHDFIFIYIHRYFIFHIEKVYLCDLIAYT